MLIRSPSCCFMCSISCSLLVDSKPQIQQQKSSTQYSIPGRVCPELLLHATAPPACSRLDDDLTELPSGPPVAEATSGDCLSFLLKTTYGRSTTVSCVDFRGVVGDLKTRRKIHNQITLVWPLTFKTTISFNSKTLLHLVTCEYESLKKTEVFKSVSDLNFRSKSS